MKSVRQTMDIIAAYHEVGKLSRCRCDVQHDAPHGKARGAAAHPTGPND